MKHCNALTLASIPGTWCLATLSTSNLDKAVERFYMMVTQYWRHGHLEHTPLTLVLERQINTADIYLMKCIVARNTLTDSFGQYPLNI